MSKNMQCLRMNTDFGETSIMDNLMNDLFQKTWREWNKKAEQYIRDNFANKGFVFENETDFLKFCKDRVTKLYCQIQNLHKIYVDYKSQEDSGTFVCSYSDKVNINHEGNKVIATIG